jgi:hypothetical protein
MSLLAQITLHVRVPQTPEAPNDSSQLSVKRVRERLAQSHHRSLRQIGCEPVGESFVLWGTVSSYHIKQLAQSLAGSVVGITRIKNRIVVQENAKSG